MDPWAALDFDATDPAEVDAVLRLVGASPGDFLLAVAALLESYSPARPLRPLQMGLILACRVFPLGRRTPLAAVPLPESLLPLALGFFAHPAGAIRNTAACFVAGVLLAELLGGARARADHFAAFLAGGPPPLCLSPAAQVFELLSDFPSLCARFAGPALAFATANLPRDCAAAALLAKLPPAVLAQADLGGIVAVVSGLILTEGGKQAAFSFLLHIVQTIPHRAWDGLLALPNPEVLFAVTPEDSFSTLVAFCELFQQIAQFEKEAKPSESLLEATGNRLAAILFDIAAFASPADGAPACDSDGKDSPAEAALSALEQILSFVDPSIIGELILANWTENAQRRETVIAFIAVAMDEFCPFRDLIAAAFVDPAPRVRQNALFCAERFCESRTEVDVGLLQLVLAQVQDSLLRADAIRVLATISLIRDFEDFELHARQLFQCLLVWHETDSLRAILEFFTSTLGHMSPIFREELVLACISQARTEGFYVCSLLEAILSSCFDITDDFAMALVHFFSEGPIDINLLFPLVNFQLHCSDAFVDCDFLIAAILPFFADPEHATFGATAIQDVQKKFALAPYANSIGAACLCAMTALDLVQSQKSPLFRIVEAFLRSGTAFPKSLGDSLRNALVVECQNVENTRDENTACAMFLCLIALVQHYPPEDFSAVEAACGLLALIAYLPPPENVFLLTPAIAALEQMFPEALAATVEGLRDSPLFLALCPQE